MKPMNVISETKLVINVTVSRVVEITVSEMTENTLS